MANLPSSSRMQALTGYVLHKRPYRETSFLVDFFTLEQGRLSAVAKGARGNVKSDRKSLLQGLQKVDFELSGRSALKNLGKIEASSPQIVLSHNALYCAFYINEIVSRALPEAEPAPALFSAYEHTLQNLSNVNKAHISAFEPLLREFEFSLLAEMGYLPDFYTDCQSEQAIKATCHYRFDVQEGFTECFSDIKHAISGQALLDLANADYGTHGVDETEQNSETNRRTNALRAAKLICRLALREIIGTKPIKSRELFLPSS